MRENYNRTQFTTGEYSVCDKHGFPIQTHDSYAKFNTSQQEDWCAELMERAFYEGQDSLRKNLRELLGVTEPEEADI